MDWLTITPPLLAIIVAVWTRNVFWALGIAIWLSETIIAGFNPFMGALGSIDRAVGVFDSPYNTRVLLFCLIIGALIVYMQRSGGISAMVERLQNSGFASTPRRAGLVTAICGVLIFVETNISLLTTGILGRPLFDKLKISRERLAYIIDSTCAPVSVLILFNGWGAYLLGLLNENGVEGATGVLMATIALNFYAWITLAIVFVTIFTNKTIGPLAAVEAGNGGVRIGVSSGPFNDAPEPPSNAVYMAIPLIIMIGGTIGFMIWTGNGDIRQGSGSQAILWSVILATVAAFMCLAHSKRAKGELVKLGFKGMGDLLPAVTMIFLALVLGASLNAVGMREFIASIASSFPAPWVIPAILFVAAGITSFTAGTSWGTYGILVPVAVPLAVGAGVPLPLAIAAVMGGGVFGDHCSPISDTTIIASLASGCDHMEHVRTQLPYALVGGVLATGFYLAAGLAS
ncbi:MAG: sodium:proton antiporter [Hyphomonadaceae bacterium]|nr:sodium:proton antiporter [Hyphomonadaceae bacterium]